MSRKTVDADTLREWLARGAPVAILDVRHLDEQAEWTIPGSVNFDASRCAAG